MPFNDIINRYLIECNANPLDGILYEQYNIVEKKGYFYILDLKENRIIGSAKTLISAKQRVDSIISGC